VPVTVVAGEYLIFQALRVLDFETLAVWDEKMRMRGERGKEGEG